MYYVDFINEFERYKKICNGNSSEICELGGFDLKLYYAATNGRLRNEDDLAVVMSAIREFVDATIADTQMSAIMP